MNSAAYVVLASLLALAAAAVGISLNILLRGRLYHRLKPESRPRRWILLFLLTLFAAFAVWFPVWMAYPQSFLAKAMILVFAAVWGITGLTLRACAGLIDTWYQRKGWPLR